MSQEKRIEEQTSDCACSKCYKLYCGWRSIENKGCPMKGGEW